MGELTFGYFLSYLTIINFPLLDLELVYASVPGLFQRNLNGVIWTIITVLYQYPHQFALTGQLLAKGVFSSLSECANQSHNFTNLVSMTSSLLVSIHLSAQVCIFFTNKPVILKISLCGRQSKQPVWSHTNGLDDARASCNTGWLKIVLTNNI